MAFLLSSTAQALLSPLLPIARSPAMMRHRDDLNVFGALNIDDTEGERPQHVTPILAIDARPAPRGLGDTEHRHIKGLEEQLRDMRIAREVPQSSVVGFIRSERMKPDGPFSHVERARGALLPRPTEYS